MTIWKHQMPDSTNPEFDDQLISVWPSVLVLG